MLHVISQKLVKGDGNAFRNADKFRYIPEASRLVPVCKSPTLMRALGKE